MAIRLSDAEIARLLAERKPLPADYRDLMQIKPKRGHKERELDVNGVEKSEFRLILRQSEFNSLDFRLSLLTVRPKRTSSSGSEDIMARAMSTPIHWTVGRSMTFTSTWRPNGIRMSPDNARMRMLNRLAALATSVAPFDACWKTAASMCPRIYKVRSSRRSSHAHRVHRA